MTNTVIFALFGDEEQTQVISSALHYEIGQITIHQFPDNESLLTFHTDIKNKDVIFLAYLDRPDPKIIQLLFAVETAKSLGAKKITLIAPYLPYMRQDKIFHQGEGISSIYFATVISRYVDRLITIDPHLHRWSSLADIYTIPTYVLHAADAIAGWIVKTLVNPVLLGPDKESGQWVKDIAQKIGSPYVVVNKERFGDQQVKNTIPEIAAFKNYYFVLIDDIISSAATMIETVEHLKQQDIQNIACVAIHAIFADDAYSKLSLTGVDPIITCNTIKHITNKIDVTDVIVAALMQIQR